MSNSAERRKSRRRPILGTFSLFVVVPKKGIHRLEVFDISDLGIGFDVDIEGENPEDFPVNPGDMLDIRLYLNQSLFLPLVVQVARIDESKMTRRVGAEFSDKMSKHFRAFQSFLHMLDAILEVAEIEPQPPV